MKVLATNRQAADTVIVPQAQDEGIVQASSKGTRTTPASAMKAELPALRAELAELLAGLQKEQLRVGLCLGRLLE